jgi:hypothetical protein
MTKKEELAYLEVAKETAVPASRRMMDQRILLLKQELGILSCDIDDDECISCSG